MTKTVIIEVRNIPRGLYNNNKMTLSGQVIKLSYEFIVFVRNCNFLANGELVMKLGKTWHSHTHFVFIDKDGIPIFRISSYSCWFKFIWGSIP